MLTFAAILGTFRSGRQHFKKLTPKLETSERDLSFGRGQVWDEVQILRKKRDAVEIIRFRTEGRKKLTENRDFAK